MASGFNGFVCPVVPVGPSLDGHYETVVWSENMDVLKKALDNKEAALDLMDLRRFLLGATEQIPQAFFDRSRQLLGADLAEKNQRDEQFLDLMFSLALLRGCLVGTAWDAAVHTGQQCHLDSTYGQTLLLYTRGVVEALAEYRKAMAQHCLACEEAL